VFFEFYVEFLNFFCIFAKNPDVYKKAIYFSPAFRYNIIKKWRGEWNHGRKKANIGRM
jgi:hypothetical protein